MKNMINRDSFVFYRSFFEALVDLPNENQLELFKAISDFSLNFKEPNLSGISKTIFTLIRPQLIANSARYKNGCKGAEHGHKGGRPKGEKTPRKPLENPKPTPNANLNPNENDNEEKKEKEKMKEKKEVVKTPPPPKRTKFIKPSIQEISQYSNEIQAGINPSNFFDFYETNGWVQGRAGKPVRDWKACVRTWKGRDSQKQNSINSKAPMISRRRMKEMQAAEQTQDNSLLMKTINQ